jgi:Actin
MALTHFLRILSVSSQVPACYVANRSVLSLFASGRTSGVVAYCGGETTTVVPVMEGYPQTKCFKYGTWSGRDVDRYLGERLGISTGLPRSAEAEVLAALKEVDPGEPFMLPDGSSISAAKDFFSDCVDLYFEEDPVVRQESNHTWGRSLSGLIRSSVLSCDPDTHAEFAKKFVNLVLRFLLLGQDNLFCV